MIMYHTPAPAYQRPGWPGWLITASLSCWCIVGCGPTTGTPISGRVTIESGGPLDRGLIIFADDRIICRGDIGSDGGYRIRSGPTGHRVPPGRYKVHFVGTGIPDEKKRETKPQIASRFEDVRWTDLVVDVPDAPAGVTMDFDLEPPAQPGR